ncbi:MAG TPA: FAD-binding oxidoreductase [Gemmatimonadaceae bacterium]|nr:FAD-binding oxidoreductase [Gemmatimonadaceae bacterium]
MKRRTRRFVRALRVLAALLALLALLTVSGAMLGALRTPIERPVPIIVSDVTGLYPIAVDRVLAPTTVEEIVRAVRSHPGPIAIGGGRYSMGGQTATEGALHLDMRRLNRIVAFDSVGRTITVQSGATWRQIQERIDPANLSIKIMQTYANFTVGGSLSVNVHGRYVGLGPLVLSVRSLQLVLADGSIVEATPSTNPEIFYGAIGGYGGLGVITQATLELAENVRVKRTDRSMPITAYKDYFFREVRDSAGAIFHNADIYPNDYTTVRALTYSRTTDSVTIPDRLIPDDRGYRLHRFVYWMISEWPFGEAIREHIVDPLIYRGEPVSWRNFEASYDVAELEPASRERSTYVLQEYFVPVQRFDEWIPKMRQILNRRDVNVINISIRHARADPGSLLAWASTEVFACVIYYKQGTSAADSTEVGVWTRELVDAALSVGGSYYLPYQSHATNAQFLRAYPRSGEFFALKKRLDPTNKFRNKLWDRYYAPRLDPSLAELSLDVRAQLDTMKDYHRDEGQTFLTHPEWYIVYSSEEYAEWLRDKLPTEFPYVSSIGQYWVNHGEARALTRGEYPLNFGYHVMLAVIGASYSAELMLKGVYENITGRFTGWTSGGRLSDEDRYAYEVAADYGRFIHVRPWYEYPFAAKLRDVWADVPFWGDHLIRKWERKLFLTAEYGIKALYGALIAGATGAAYAPEADRMHMVVTGWKDSLSQRDGRFTVRARLDSAWTLVSTARYDVFRDALMSLAASGANVRIVEIAGNDDILLTAVAPASWRYTGTAGRVVYALPLASDGSRKRVAMRVPVRELLSVLATLQTGGSLAVDHIYDY